MGAGTTRRIMAWIGSATIVGVAIAVVAAAGSSVGNVAAGKKIYAVKCVACHKADGSGGLKLTGNPTPNWKDAKRMADPSTATITCWIAREHGKPKSGMVGMEQGRVKPADIENLIAYIHQKRSRRSSTSRSTTPPARPSSDLDAVRHQSEGGPTGTHSAVREPRPDDRR